MAELKQKDGAVLRKAKLSVYKKVFEHISLFQKKQILLPQNRDMAKSYSQYLFLKCFENFQNFHRINKPTYRRTNLIIGIRARSQKVRKMRQLPGLNRTALNAIKTCLP